MIQINQMWIVKVLRLLKSSRVIFTMLKFKRLPLFFYIVSVEGQSFYRIIIIIWISYTISGEDELVDMDEDDIVTFDENTF